MLSQGAPPVDTFIDFLASIKVEFDPLNRSTTFYDVRIPLNLIFNTT